jgi:hypothetical protein
VLPNPGRVDKKLVHGMGALRKGAAHGIGIAATVNNVRRRGGLGVGKSEGNNETRHGGERTQRASGGLKFRLKRSLCDPKARYLRRSSGPIVDYAGNVAYALAPLEMRMPA